ncbi:2'-hydroxybiphenyl-2-sulfinate desulfinase [Saccharothrix tamanrassetensis]|uniref:2'-hydroxybiphenyl-2-sulfinate desulfinase n=1 Tax=Saccharothrix tamanrassetensis TaxID=1051531 RepID=A0A841CDR3_9PSEU|nr:ABC transporter substrate-binding protein [Saccharothrix tamanrassetensis]MBB5954308.1 2'-hydroxybiphenyl-2-sulfinate desulfinase [Saccharothrix tamanrassetensis]
MSTRTLEQNRIWYTRCPVPTASGLAYNLGWLAEEFAAEGLDVGVLQDAAPEIAARHFDHRLVGLFREGGNVPALVAKSEGAPTRLIGLTWIDESQVIVVRPDSGITSPEHLAGRRVALPALAADRARSFPRAMALHGFAGALGTVGLSTSDVVFTEVPTGQGDVGPGDRGGGSLFGVEALARGDVDAVYIKGAQAAEQAAAHGLVIGIDLDSFADRRFRVNNGTPRPITVHERILAERPDLVVRFLAQTLRAADWAAGNLDRVREILARETRSGAEGVVAAYRDGFHKSLHPDLSAERLDLLTRQKDFLLVHGFLAQDVDIRAWAAHEPLAEAVALLEEGR